MHIETCTEHFGSYFVLCHTSNWSQRIFSRSRRRTRKPLCFTNHALFKANGFSGSTNSILKGVSCQRKLIETCKGVDSTISTYFKCSKNSRHQLVHLQQEHILSRAGPSPGTKRKEAVSHLSLLLRAGVNPPLWSELRGIRSKDTLVSVNDPR